MVRRGKQLAAVISVRPLAWMPWLLAVCLSSGCISSSYRYGIDRSGSLEPINGSTSGSAQSVTFGEPSAGLARLEKVVQFPRETIRKLRGQPPREPDSESIERLAAVSSAEEYLAANGLDELYIDVRIYDPREQWRRLKANDSLHPVFRYTGGSLSWLRYTLLPRTVFRSDHFDPFTNTLSLNSDDSARAILESAQAKEFYRERLLGRGAYATLQLLPIVPMIHETRVANDALNYSKHHLEGRFLEDIYPLAYARVGSSAVSEALSVFSLPPGAPFLARPLLIGTGNLTGRSIGRVLHSEQQQAEPETTKE